MSKLNPIIEALDGIDENFAAEATKKRKAKKPLKIVVISVAAALLLGGTAAAATLGEHPLVKLNGNQVTPKYSSYVNADGWTVETTVVQLPIDTAAYKPAGEIRGVLNGDDIEIYDELGVKVYDVSGDLNIYCNAAKPGETPIHTLHSFSYSDYHEREDITADGVHQIEFWQDPIQAARSAAEQSRYDRMSVDEKVNYLLMWGWDIGYPEYGGFERPTMRELVELGAQTSSGSAVIADFEQLPGEIMPEYYGYEPVSLDGFTEKSGLQTLIFNQIKAADNSTEEKLISQEMFIYTLTDAASGKDVKFTVWRSADEKDVYTDHFGFEYEYISLNNGTTARLHQSGFSSYIVEFEKDGAAYGIQCDIDRELVERVLQKMDLL